MVVGKLLQHIYGLLLLTQKLQSQIPATLILHSAKFVDSKNTKFKGY